MIAAFGEDEQVRGTTIRSACFGIAGPVLGHTAELTNVTFLIDASEIGQTFNIPERVRDVSFDTE